jgi:hypothetical protein
MPSEAERMPDDIIDDAAIRQLYNPVHKSEGCMYGCKSDTAAIMGCAITMILAAALMQQQTAVPKQARWQYHACAMESKAAKKTGATLILSGLALDWHCLEGHPMRPRCSFVWEEALEVNVRYLWVASD